MQLILSRHGEAASNLAAPDSRVGAPANLTERGRAQVEATALFLGRLASFDVVYASPLPRTLETASIYAALLELPLVTDARLKEINKGDWQGKLVSEVIELESQVDIDERHRFRPPGGENWQDVGERMRDFIHEIEGRGQNIIAVSHDHPIRMGIGALLEKPITSWEDMALDFASVTRLTREDGEDWQLDQLLVNFKPYERPAV